MSYAIVRMFATPDIAAKALALLEEQGLTREENHLNLVTPATAATADGLVAAIKSGMIVAADAKVYAQGVLRGHGLVSLLPPFGTGRIYQDLLDKLNPIDSGIEAPNFHLGWDEAAPLSSALSLPVLLKPSPYQFMGLPAIDKSGRTTFGSFGLPEIASSDFSVFGSPNLSRNPAPLSGLLRLPLLTRS